MCGPHALHTPAAAFTLACEERRGVDAKGVCARWQRDARAQLTCVGGDGGGRGLCCATLHRAPGARIGVMSVVGVVLIYSFCSLIVFVVCCFFFSFVCVLINLFILLCFLVCLLFPIYN